MNREGGSARERRRRGFTLVELVVVIAVIAILATLATLGLSRYLADGRDHKREANVAAVSEALEKYYDQNGEYPSCGTMTANADTVANTLKGLDKSALVTPGEGSSTGNSVRCNIGLTTSGDDFFEYVGDGSPDCNGSGSCLTFKLRYKNESENTIKEVDSRRQTSIATSNTPIVTVEGVSISSVDLSWTAVANASSYNIERATNSTFTAGVQSFTSLAPSTTVTGLTSVTQYYFRVAGVSGTVAGPWSEAATATTTSLGAVVLSSTMPINSPTQITVNWATVEGAATYRIERSTSSSYTSPVVLSGITSTTTPVSSLTTGTLYYFRIRAETGGITGPWTAFQAGATTVPTGVTATPASCTSITASWSASTGASTQYRLYFSTSSTFNPSDNSALIATTSQTRTSLDVLATYYFRVKAFLGLASTDYSASASAATTTCVPAAYTITCSNNGTSLTCTSQAVCEGGTTPYYYWYANSGAWQQGTTYKTVTYTPGYDQVVTLTLNTRCDSPGGNGPWVGATNSGSFTRGIPAPGAPSWVRHVVSNNTTMLWNAPGCAAGTQVSHVQIVRKTTGALQQDSGDLWNATSWVRGSLPVATWLSYVFSRCQGTHSSSGWGPSAVAQAG